jgi:Tol biopolymer transport system component
VGLPLTLLRVLVGAAKPLAVGAVIIGGSLGLWRFALGGLAESERQVPEPSIELQAEAPLVVYSEFGAREDTIWAADSADPERRSALATVEHAEGYGIFASLSPDGLRIAYTALPPTESYPSADAPAELWVIEADGANGRLLATGVDLLIAPVWSPDGASLLVRRSASVEDAAGSFELLRVDVAGQVVKLVGSTSGLFPIGFSPDGEMIYYAQLSAEGTDLGRVPADGATGELIAHLSDDIARDWHLSPDGTRLAYLAAREGTAGFSAHVLDLGGGAVAAAPTDAFSALNARGAQAPDEFNPIWHPDGQNLTVGRIEKGIAAPAVSLSSADGSLQAMAGPQRGFDVPLSWSPDGGYLAVRAFTGSSASDPGSSQVVVVAAGAGRLELSSLSDVEVIGWLP